MDAMSVKAQSRVWDHSTAQGTDLLVLLAIADAADDDGRNAWPSVATLARKCRVSPRSVQYAIARLSEAGELVVEHQAGGNVNTRSDRRPNRYRVTIASGVQDLHPAAERGEAQRATGCNPARDGVKRVAPYPSLNHPEPSARTGDPLSSSSYLSLDDDRRRRTLNEAWEVLAVRALENRNTDLRERGEDRKVIPPGRRTKAWLATAAARERDEYEAVAGAYYDDDPTLDGPTLAGLLSPELVIHWEEAG